MSPARGARRSSLPAADRPPTPSRAPRLGQHGARRRDQLGRVSAGHPERDDLVADADRAERTLRLLADGSHHSGDFTARPHRHPAAPEHPAQKFRVGRIHSRRAQRDPHPPGRRLPRINLDGAQRLRPVEPLCLHRDDHASRLHSRADAPERDASSRRPPGPPPSDLQDPIRSAGPHPICRTLYDLQDFARSAGLPRALAPIPR